MFFPSKSLWPQVFLIFCLDYFHSLIVRFQPLPSLSLSLRCCCRDLFIRHIWCHPSASHVLKWFSRLLCMVSRCCITWPLLTPAAWARLTAGPETVTCNSHLRLCGVRFSPLSLHSCCCLSLGTPPRIFFSHLDSYWLSKPECRASCLLGNFLRCRPSPRGNFPLPQPEHVPPAGLTFFCWVAFPITLVVLWGQVPWVNLCIPFVCMPQCLAHSRSSNICDQMTD